MSLMGQARIYIVLGRERLLPPWLAAVHAERKTPVNATVLTALSGGAHPWMLQVQPGHQWAPHGHGTVPYPIPILAPLGNPGQ